MKWCYQKDDAPGYEICGVPVQPRNVLVVNFEARRLQHWFGWGPQNYQANERLEVAKMGASKAFKDPGEMPAEEVRGHLIEIADGLEGWERIPEMDTILRYLKDTTSRGWDVEDWEGMPEASWRATSGDIVFETGGVRQRFYTEEREIIRPGSSTNLDDLSNHWEVFNSGVDDLTTRRWGGEFYANCT